MATGLFTEELTFSVIFQRITTGREDGDEIGQCCSDFYYEHFQNTAKLKEFYIGWLYTHHLDCNTNILLYCFIIRYHFLYLSIYLFLTHFKVLIICKLLCTSPCRLPCRYHHLELNIHLKLVVLFFFLDVKFTCNEMQKS